MALEIEVQRADSKAYCPADDEFETWVRACDVDPALTGMTLRIVDEQEGAELNGEYRDKHSATNVLSFPGQDDALPAELNTYLGDLVICATVVNREAETFGMPPADRWMHIVVHGVLHLMGYDHMAEADREVMEAHERRILSRFGIEDPYTLD